MIFIKKADLDKTIQRHVCGACLMKLRGIYNYKCKVLTTEEQIVKYFHDNKVPSRTKLDLNYLIKEEKQIDDIALNIDNTYESLVSLIDRSKSESNNSSMCFYKETVYKCFMCDFASINYTSLTDHYKNIHHKHVEIVIEDIPQEKEKEETKYCCEYPGCTYSTTAPYSIASHKTFHLRNFACGKCGSRHGNIQAAARHIASHNEANIAVKCALCGFKTANMSVARKHYFTAHKDCDVVAECDLKIDKNGNDCDIKTLCDDLSMMLDSFDTDKLGEDILSLNTSKSSQKQLEVFACKQCPYSTDDPTSLTSHERSAHNKKRRRDSNTSVETSESGKTLRSNSSLGKKTRSASEAKKVTSENSGELEALFKCKFRSCTYTTNNELSLRNHKNSAHCSYRLSQTRTKVNMKPKLVSNMKMNVKVMKKKLPVDKKTTPADKKSSDVKEKNEELKTDKHKEKKSSSASATKSSDSQKISVKNDDKTDKSKSKKASAKRIFGCAYCESCFATLDKANEHFSSNHSEKTLYFKCGLCNSKNLFKHKLKEHHKKSHGIKWKPVAKVVNNKGKPQAVENKEEVKKEKKNTKRKIYVVENKNRPGYGRLRCPHCPYVTENYQYFITHWLIHSKPFSCAYCGHLAAEVRTIKNHIQSQHPGCAFQIRCAFKNCTFECADATLSSQHFTEMHKDTKEHLQEFFDDYHYIKKRLNRRGPVKKIKNKDVSIALTKQEDKDNSTAASRSDHEEEDPRENNDGGNTPPPILTKEEPIKLEYDQHESRFKVESVVENNFAEDQNDTDRCESPLLDVLNHSDSLAEQNDDTDTYNCPHCTEKFLSLEDLDNHSKAHESHQDSQVPPIKCCFCSFEASDKAELRKHYVSDHNSKEGKEIDFNKEDGEDVIKEKVKEELIMSNIPEGSENEIIEIPDDVFSEEADDELMENEVHNSSETQPQEDLLYCNICRFSSNDKESMVSHKKIHAANPFVCVKCDQSFGESSELKDHLSTHEKEQEESTKPVEAEDDDSDQLKHDDLLATVKYSCEKCSFRTVDDEKMRVHHQKCKRKLAYKERQMRVVHKNVDPYEKKMTSYKTIINRDINEEDKRDGKRTPDDANSSQNSSDQENEKEVKDLNDSIVCLDEPVEDNSNTNDAVEKLREEIELEENETNAKEHSASVAPVQMIDPFESDSEDYCKTLEEAIASIDVPRPMVVPKKESDESAIVDNSDKMEFMDETATAPKISLMEDLVVIDDDDDD